MYLRPLTVLFGDEATLLDDRNFRILLLVALIIPFGAGLLSPILDSLIGPFDASTASIGLMISVFWAPGILIVPVTGALADRFGRKLVLVASLILFGSAGSAIALTSDFDVVLGLRLLQGVGWAGILPIVVTSTGDLFVASREAAAQGIRHAVTSVTGGALSIVAGVLVVFAWQYPFLLYLLVIPIAVVVYLWFDEPTSESGVEGTGHGQDGPYRAALFGVVRQPRVLAILLGRFLPVMNWIGFTTFNSIIVIRLLDGTAVHAGLLYALMSLSAAISASQLGRLMARGRSRYSLLAGANTFILLGFPIIVFAPSLVVAAVGTIVLGGGIGLAVTLYRSTLASMAPSSVRTGVVSLGATGGRFVGTMTPIAMGGLLALLTPVMSFTPAVQLTGIAVAIVGGGGGIVCTLAARASPPLERRGRESDDAE